MNIINNFLKLSFLDKIFNFIDNIKEDHIITFNINIPKNVVIRTQLICDLVQEEHNYIFNINNFLMLLYINFIKTSIKSYNPEKTFKLLTQSFYEPDLILTNGSDKCIVKRNNYEYNNITIEIDKNDFEKGQLILDELFDIYKYKISFSHLIEALWLDFIEAYKSGSNKKAYYFIIQLLKQNED